MTKINYSFDELIELPVKAFAYQTIDILIQSGRFSDLLKLTDPIFCRKYFVSELPILRRVTVFDSITEEMLYENGKKCYFPLPVICSDNKFLIVSKFRSGPRKDTRTPFLRWILGEEIEPITAEK